MVETISSLSAIMLCVEFFCLGGSVFAHKEHTKSVLRTIVIVFGILCIANSW